MKKSIAGIFCFLAGVLSVNLFSASAAEAHSSHGSAAFPVIQLDPRKNECRDEGGMFLDEECLHRCDILNTVSSSDNSKLYCPKDYPINRENVGYSTDWHPYWDEYHCNPPYHWVESNGSHACERIQECYGHECIKTEADCVIHNHDHGPYGEHRSHTGAGYEGWTPENSHSWYWGGCRHTAQLIASGPIAPEEIEEINEILDLDPVSSPLVRESGDVQSSAESVSNIASELGIQSAGYAPISDPQTSAPAESDRLPEYAAPAALLGALAFSSLYPDYSVNHSFDFLGENESVNWEAGMRGDFHHGYFSSFISAVQSDSGFAVHSGTTYRSDSFRASYTTVEAKDYMNYAVQLSAPWQHRGWEIDPNLSSQFHYDRDENHSSSESGAGLDLEYRF